MIRSARERMVQVRSTAHRSHVSACAGDADQVDGGGGGDWEELLVAVDSGAVGAVGPPVMATGTVLE